MDFRLIMFESLMMWHLLLLALLLPSSFSQHFLPNMPPIFYLCTFHGRQDQSSGSQQVALSISITGSPTFFVPGKKYEVKIQSSQDFDEFLLVGLWTVASESLLIANTPNMAAVRHFQSQNTLSAMCSLVHNHNTLSPTHAFSFIWVAPPKGYGCVSFLATAKLSHELLFKDTTVLKLCEEGSESLTTSRPPLIAVHEDGVIMRDDFEGSDDLQDTLWKESVGVKVTAECGTILYGKSATFCEKNGGRKLRTVPLNITTGSSIQFTAGSGNCHPSYDDGVVTLSYSTLPCTNWTHIEAFRIDSGPTFHLVHLPQGARTENVCLQFQQVTSAKDRDWFEGCWALDNVIVVNLANPPQSLAEQFDPISTENWLFFPGGLIQAKCVSRNNGLVFSGTNDGFNGVTSRDLDLQQQIDSKEAIFSQFFQDETYEGWNIKGGGISDSCSDETIGLSALMNKESKSRQICTPFIDLSNVGNVRFTFGAGTQKCPNVSISEVFVYAEDKLGHTQVVRKLEMNDYREPKLVSVSLTNGARKRDMRLCWLQKSQSSEGVDIWLLDDVLFYPLQNRNNSLYVQFSINLMCASKVSNSVSLEFSTDHGATWQNLYEPCLPLSYCRGAPQLLLSEFSNQDSDSWTRHTLPIPLAAQTQGTRFRWRQKEGPDSDWAIDNVYVGYCPHGCNGHGECTPSGCSCDIGFLGKYCETTATPVPSLLVDSMSSPTSMKESFAAVRGGTLGYGCGVLGSGKALVFNQDGPRMLVTRNINMTKLRHVQFSMRIGSDTQMGSCPGPDKPSESVLLQYTCSGGIKWDILAILHHKDFTQPIMVTEPLPEEARCPLGQIRWVQPEHSGSGEDVWALDDIALTSTLHNTIELTFNNTNQEKIQQTVDSHFATVGPFCGRENTLRFTNTRQASQARYVATATMHVGPSFILQFQLSMGCQLPHHLLEDRYPIILQYSTDAGMSWAPVLEGCWPPQMCKEYHEPSIYFATQYQNWTRVTIVLPHYTWSSSTRFQWFQEEWTIEDQWAVADLYIGQRCPKLCHGHGSCQEARCRCDPGFSGTTCLPIKPLPKHMKTSFSFVADLQKNWHKIHGGELAGALQGCRTILSGESLYFAKGGPRLVETKDLDLQNADYIQFYFRLGGGETPFCQGANERQEGVLLQYSSDGGISWAPLEELYFSNYRQPEFVHVVLPEGAKSSISRLRWWQPQHSGRNHDQWAIDEVYVGKYEVLADARDSFQDVLSDDDSMWLTITEGMYGPYCHSADDTLMFPPQSNDKFAMTKDLQFQSDYVIQFKINVGCSSLYSHQNPVLLQWSGDAGLTWKLVEEPCYVINECTSQLGEGSVYYRGTHGQWSTVVIPVPQDMLKGPVNLRWWQQGGSGTSFAIDDVYIGVTCPKSCQGHGTCVEGKCSCDDGFHGETCESTKQPLHGLMDRFDDMYVPQRHWQRIVGGSLGRGCGILSEGDSLYFDGEGAREAKTVPMNISVVMMLEFVVRIGSSEDRHGCHKPQDHSEAVVVDYSLDNGISWQMLKTLDPMLMSDAPQLVSLKLPKPARTSSTTLRWWQPIAVPGKPRAEWALDNVVIGVNDSSSQGFQENFDPLKPEIWYMAMNALPRSTCHSESNALEFSKMGKKRYAETWDYIVTPWTFMQFNIAMGCSGTYSSIYEVKLEFSTDMGKTWQPVLESCLPPKKDCAGYHLSSSFSSQSHANWTRITVYLPLQAVSGHTRFRWLQDSVTLRGNIWALDNIYLGEGCPWMCSGHGRCLDDKCLCDPGYGGPFCVSQHPLPMDQRDSFDQVPSSVLWPELYGGEISHICGTLNSGTSLAFFKERLRMLVSRDLDVSMAMYMQFTFQFGCLSTHDTWPMGHGVLVQYSVNGGIRWNTLTEIPPIKTMEPRLITINLPNMALSNSTRFRFWQPQHDGPMQSIWAIDNVHIGGTMLSTDAIFETFDTDDLSDNWIFWPGSKVTEYCHFNIRSPTILAGTSSLMFSGGDGERSVMTTELYVNDLTVVQFDINVGCTSRSSHFHPVRFEYSNNLGKSWQLVVPSCGMEGINNCGDRQQDASIYYPGSSEFWQRVIIPMSGLNVCGLVRFRWTQGKILQMSSVVSDWALDNVYIGLQCPDHCFGHGTCVQGLVCQCDDGFGPDDICLPNVPFPTELQEDFEDNNWEWHTFTEFSGGVVSDKCGTLLDGRAMFFSSPGLRRLATRDLNLTNSRVVQFFMKLGCGSHSPQANIEPVFLQYSTNGGISWILLERFDFGFNNVDPVYYAIKLPQEARTNATRIRWDQNTVNGTYSNTWAIDQIYIGGNIYGRATFHGDLSQNRDSWLMFPGGSIKPACGYDENSLLFSGQSTSRFAVTPDVTVTDATFLQFSLIMACTATTECYEIELQYSLDLGKTWHRLQEPCLPSQLQCNNYQQGSIYGAESFTGWHRITLPLPPKARSINTRFRWIQHSFDIDDWWAIKDVYIGDECKHTCGGHGSCVGGACICDEGWGGNNTCNQVEVALSSHLRDDFTNGLNRDMWSAVLGGVADTQCGVLASGPSLHFTGSCSRKLVTTELDLRTAMLMQLFFRFGCLSQPTNTDEAVLVDYSADGGATWVHMIQLYHDHFNQASFVSVDLPEDARKEGVLIRLWQPTHPGLGKADWAVDNIMIGGNLSSPDSLTDAFQSDAVDDISWVQHDNLVMDSYCGEAESLHGVASSKENVTLTSQDMNIREGYILQFSITVGCGMVPLPDGHVAPVHLEYSLDHGLTWHPLVDTCMTFLPHCMGKGNTPSVFYPDQGWRRITIPLRNNAISRGTRFRWIQVTPDSTRVAAWQWGIRQVYIGPACSDMCSGQGFCKYPTCHCDKGFYGDSCQVSTGHKDFMKDTFDADGASSNWLLLQGALIGEACALLSSGKSFYFTGNGLRQAVTIDLDLRNARFVQYTALIAKQLEGPRLTKACTTPESRNDSVVVQYSINGGIDWHTLHVLDHTMYWRRSHTDYIPLPNQARTHSTRLRWWQMTSDSPSAPWAIDDVYIGGSLVNPSHLDDSFNGDINDKSWLFYPNGAIERNVCGAQNVFSWNAAKGVRRATTNQLIIQENYMIQFKIQVGCEGLHHSCNTNQSVHLLFNKKPSVDSWSLVIPICLVNGHESNLQCHPYTYGIGSIYSANTVHNWTRITIPLPPRTYSSETRFRWMMMESEEVSGPSWSLDDIYIGEQCPQLCNGRGDCRNGTCVCDPGYVGDSCRPQHNLLLSHLTDTMEGGVVGAHWDRVVGGNPGLGCGALFPHAHGKTLYFNGCGIREAVTVEMDTTQTSKVMFVLQIGSHHQASSCNVDLDSSNPASVLLLYSVNKGIEWILLATHEPKEYLKPRKVSYDIPPEARTFGIQWRWWQPHHRGKGHDQWAIDHVEIVMTLQEKFYRTEFRKHIRRHHTSR